MSVPPPATGGTAAAGPATPTVAGTPAPAAAGPPAGTAAPAADGTAGGTADAVAATVGGEPVTAAEVAAEVARLRSGPLADRLPPDGSPAGRQLRRWTTQRLVLRRLLDQEAAGRHVAVAATADGPPRQPGPGLRPDPALLGSAAADVLASSPAARAVYASVTAAISVPEDEVRAHYERNLDRYSSGDRWLVRQLTTTSAPQTGAAALAGGPAPVLVDPATLPPPLRRALGAVEPGHVVGPLRSPLGWHLAARHEVRPAGPRPYPEVRTEISRALLDRRRQQAFARWLDGRVAELVRLNPGYEHPADPANPDATHRH